MSKRADLNQTLRERGPDAVREEFKRAKKVPPPETDEKAPNGNGGNGYDQPNSDAPIARKGYMKTKSKNSWASNVGNILRALETEPGLKSAFGFDQMLRTEMVLRPVIVLHANEDRTMQNAAPFKPRPITDADVCMVQAHLQWFGFRRLGKDTAHEAISTYARNAFHLVRKYLDALQWDGIPRLDTWLPTYLGTERSDYTKGIGTMFMIGMVARIYKPGCKLDYMLVLEGLQGSLKSTACAVLAGEYFSDQLPDITSKEAAQHLRGKWLIEVAELRAYSRAASLDHFKEFITRDTERYRPPWGRKEMHEPRQCCFIGTTNKAVYLRDETGNPRSGRSNVEGLRRDRDQLLAEAVARFRQGEIWWPAAEFVKTCIAEQEKRYEPDVWQHPIARYLDALHHPKRTTIIQIAVGALGYEVERPLIRDRDELHPARGTPINKLTPFDQQRITAVLTHLQWEPKRNEKERWWQPIAGAK